MPAILFVGDDTNIRREEMSQPEGRLGAEWIEGGVRFSLFSENAEGVELCLFEADDHSKETARVP